MFFSPVFAEQIPNYDIQHSPIFINPVNSSVGKEVVTTITPTWNSDRYLIHSISDDEDGTIKISTLELTKYYVFTKPDLNFGMFTAEVILNGFSYNDDDMDPTLKTTGNGSTSGFLKADADSSITISFENGVVLAKSGPMQWSIDTIQFSEENYFSDKTALLRVVDPDLNLNPESLDHIPIKVSSDSDNAGIKINAIETSEESGVFIATITFTQNKSSSGNRLFVMPGDTIFAKYDDHTLPKPYSISDSLEIKTSAKIVSSISALKKLRIAPIFLSDASGNQLKSFSTNHQMQIVGNIMNEQNFKQKFIYIIQVKDENNFVTSVSWIQGEISGNQNLDVSQSWTPTLAGTYNIESYLWNSLTDSIPLSTPLSTSIFAK
ncbi:MAG: hypothetical protein JHC41_03810 [Nitrosopumilus sp.]|nr:hypothetical protein [Nitrosopumilus sp.]